jgi:hypothetical protein
VITRSLEVSILERSPAIWPPSFAEVDERGRFRLTPRADRTAFLNEREKATLKNRRGRVIDRCGYSAGASSPKDCK